MKYRLLIFVPILMLTACVTSSPISKYSDSLPIESSYSASTPFVPLPYTGKEKMGVERGEPFMQQPFRYFQKAVLVDDDVNNYTELNLELKKGASLFAVSYRTDELKEKDINNISAKGISTVTAFCINIEAQTASDKEKSNRYFNNKLHCFFDSNNDSKFDTLYEGRSTNHFPETIHRISKEGKKIKPLSYEVDEGSESKADGILCFKISESYKKRLFISLHLGSERTSKMLGESVSISKDNLPQKIKMFGMNIEVQKDEGGVTMVKLDTSLSVYSKFSLHTKVRSIFQQALPYGDY